MEIKEAHTNQVNVISISGGKDSTAMWLYALEKNIPNLEVVFADIGHEHPKTYDYIDYLEENLGEVRRIKADFTKQIERKRKTVVNKWRSEQVADGIIEAALEVLKPTGVSFLDLCLWKGRFPSVMARFCTQELKVRPMFDQVYLPLLEQGKHVVSWLGIRADESHVRSKMTEREFTPEGYEIYRPILKWNVSDVFEMHKKHGIKPNPLYLEGMSRVGCMPCIYSRKQEIFEISRRYPEEIERISEWERQVSLASKRGASSFFTHGKRGKGIHDVVAWSKTSWGGRSIDWQKVLEEIPACTSQYGLCE